ncbi:MAG: hypothetical protein AAB590_01680 [Patescibacteria group bacterium]
MKERITQQELIEPRAITKKHDKEGRDVVATQVREAREKMRSVLEGITRNRESAVKNTARIHELEFEKESKQEALAQATERLLAKIKSVFGMTDQTVMNVEQDIDTIEQEIGTLTTEMNALREEIVTLYTEQNKIVGGQNVLDAYYEKARSTPLTQEEKRELLTPEVLENLSTQEYIALWRRLNPAFLAHTTRQGFRDHSAMIYHSAGLEQFHDGFASVLTDEKKVRPPFAVEGLRARDEANIIEFMKEGEVLEAADEKEARKRLDELLNYSWASAPKYPDKTAVHFTAQMVGDEYYGGETGNEVFFVFPSDVLASQNNFSFNGWQKDFTHAQSEDKWNDVFVWPNKLDDPGMSVDTGIVFLPKNTPVDPETGSKYASELKSVEGQNVRAMIEDSELVDAFIRWFRGLNDQSAVKIAIKAYSGSRDYRRNDELRREYENTLRTDLINLGINEDVALHLGSSLFHQLDLDMKVPDEHLREKLQSSRGNFKRADKTVPSQEYWEKYFEANPHLRPKHIVYYEGDPTSAILRFQQENDIGKADTSATDGQLLGYDDHFVLNMRDDPRANVGLAELKATAEKIIEDHYRT